MPNRDGTGPKGKGPNTGRGLGGCKEKSDDKPVVQSQNQGKGQANRRRRRGN